MKNKQKKTLNQAKKEEKRKSFEINVKKKERP